MTVGLNCGGTTFKVCVRNDGTQATTLTLASTTFAITGLNPAQTPAVQATACGPSCVGACSERRRRRDRSRRAVGADLSGGDESSGGWIVHADARLRRDEHCRQSDPDGL